METKLSDALTEATALLDDGDHDVAGFLDYLLRTSQRVLEVDAIGTMLKTQGGRLQLLGATTHQSAELELHQSQIEEGPCVDAALAGEAMAITGEDELRAQWPTFGASMLVCGFQSVHAAPLRLHDVTIGAMALFRRDARPFTPEEDDAAQAFADLIARLVLIDDQAGMDDAERLINIALGSRSIVEQAKGAIAQEQSVEMGDAYDVLRALADERDETLSAVAYDVVDRAAEGAEIGR